MKYVKITLGALVIAIATCFASTFATIQPLNVTLKALYGETLLAEANKQTYSNQFYKNEGTINSCTSNYVSVKVRVHSTAGGYSSWKQLGHQDMMSLGDYNTTQIPRTYSAQGKNVSTPCTSNHFGMWYLDY